MVQSELELVRANPAILTSRNDLPCSVNQENRLAFEAAHRNPWTVPEPPFQLTLGFTLSGRLRIEALEAALNEIVRRHSVLRSSFFARPTSSSEQEARNREFLRRTWCTPGSYRCTIKDQARLTLSTTDLTRTEPPAQERSIQLVLGEEFTRPFDLDAPCLLRGRLLQTDALSHLLILSVHHMVADLWSVRTLQKELSVLYADAAAARPFSLPPLEMQYSDFAASQMTRFYGGEFDSSIAWWREQWDRFEGAQVRYSDLPGSRSAPEAKTWATGEENLILDAAEAELLRSFARRSRVTFPMLCMGAFQLLLQCYSGKPAIAFWSHFANRITTASEALIGWFANSHLVATDLSGRPTFLEALQRVRSSVVRAGTHQALPTALLWRAMGRTPVMSDAFLLFDGSVVAGNTHAPESCADRLTIRRAHLPPIPGRQTHAGLSVNVVDVQEGIAIRMLHSRDRLPSETVRRYLEDFRKILGLAIDNPQRRDFPL